jgi:hypothetical protein
MKKIKILPLTLAISTLWSCNAPQAPQYKDQNAEGKVLQATYVPNDFNAYWYAGKAEISSYTYQINRYDEARTGYAVLVFVTEPFSKSKQVKLDYPDRTSDDNISVLKLNTLQRFETGIYDYSMMTSLFTPVDLKAYPHSLKWNTSVQDWCGQVFSQLNWRGGNKYSTEQYSYFEMEGDKAPTTEGVLLEDELFTRLRINPASLPTEKVKVIPNLTYTRIRHKPIDGLAAQISFKDMGNGTKTCLLNYETKRRLEILFEANFPYKILGFVEFEGDKEMSRASLKKTILSDYWAKHDNKHAYLRDELGL